MSIPFPHYPQKLHCNNINSPLSLHFQHFQPLKMATTFTTVTLPVSFSRQRKTRKPNTKPSPSPSIPRKNPNFKSRTRYKPPPRPVPSSPGGDATTYTRLPPRDDSSLAPVSEVKLSDSIVAKITDDSKFNGFLVSEEESQGGSEVENGVGGELGFGYGAGDVFEGKLGSLKEDDDEEDSDLGFGYRVGDVFEGKLGSLKEVDGELGFGYRVGEVFEGNLSSLKEEDGEFGFRSRVGEVFEGKLGSLEEEEEEEKEEEEDEDGELGFGYRVGEVFEGKSGSLEEEEEDSDIRVVYEYADDSEEEEEEEEERDLKFESGKIVRGYDSDGNRVMAKLYVVGDEDDDDFDGGFENGELGKFEGGLEKEEGQVKEKGLPAVMRCFDLAKIYVKAGNGGNGVVAFRREKFVPLGGPSGGDGGRGGNVYVEVDGSMNSLLPFRNSIHFRAGRGEHGQGRKMAGAKGEDVVVKVAPGTVIREAGKEEVLLELLYPGQKALLLPGGRGGRGNASFKTGMNKVPKIAENGEEGPEM